MFTHARTHTHTHTHIRDNLSPHVFILCWCIYKNIFWKIFFTHFGLVSVSNTSLITVDFIFPLLSPLRRWYHLECWVISWFILVLREEALSNSHTKRLFQAECHQQCVITGFWFYLCYRVSKNASHSRFLVSQYIKLLDPLTSSLALFFLAAYWQPQYYYPTLWRL